MVIKLLLVVNTAIGYGDYTRSADNPLGNLVQTHPGTPDDTVLCFQSRCHIPGLRSSSSATVAGCSSDRAARRQHLRSARNRSPAGGRPEDPVCVQIYLHDVHVVVHADPGSGPTKAPGPEQLNWRLL